MKGRLVYWLFLLGSPFAVAAALVYGRRFDSHLGGLLLQVCGGFVGLGWTTWLFLETGQALTRLLGTQTSEQGSEAEGVSQPPNPRPAPAPRRRAA